MKSTLTHYGKVAIWVHWLTAAALLALLISGLIGEDMKDEATKDNLLRLHAPLGIAVLLLTLFRIGWWMFADKHPAPLTGQPLWKMRTANAVHLLLYGVMIVMGVSGIAMMVLSGAGEILFFGAERALPDFYDFVPRVPHGIGAKLIMALLVGHIGAALWHHFVDRDATLSRMGLGKKT